MCDYEDVCSYFEISTGLVCIPDMDCYEPADALDIYFSYVNEEFDSQEMGISHGIHPLYCASTLTKNQNRMSTVLMNAGAPVLIRLDMRL
jgi:hypothetical protein